MVKVVLNYDPATGALEHSGGVPVMLGVINDPSMMIDRVTQGSDNIIELLKIGVTAEDVIKMKNNGVI